MSWTWATIDWTATGTVAAAWVQAVGSVLAIGAAVWIDQGSARRQARAMAHQDGVRLQEQADVSLGAAGQAAYVLRYSEDLLSTLRDAANIVPAAVLYERWRLVAADHADVLHLLIQRISDPTVLMHTVSFARAARPPSFPRTNVRGEMDYEGTVSDGVQAMRFSHDQLLEAAATLLIIAQTSAGAALKK